MSESYLLLWLEAPLQAWGHDSKFGRRDSLDFPTKSGVLGLLCCARGAGGKEQEWLAEWADMDMQVQAYIQQDSKGQSLPRLPLMKDFQMVGSGFDTSDPWQTLLIPKTSDGKKAVGGGTKMTYRYYLQDMAFAVALQGPRPLLNNAIEALNQPVWDLYLGRKNCVPTEFIAQGVYETASDALEAGERLATEKKRTIAFKVKQGEHEGEVLTLNDVPVQFGNHKKYRDRRVTVQKIVVSE
jgi:CRISPR system Cascade subunit CasD